MNIEKILDNHRLWERTDGEEGKQADLSGKDLPGLDFSGLDLRVLDLKGAHLHHTNFKGAHLHHTNFKGAWLHHTNFKGAWLHHTNFKGADIRQANFEGAWLHGADFTEATMGDLVIHNDNHYMIHMQASHNYITIRCETHTPDEWLGFTDREVDKMDSYTLDWCRKNEDLVFELYKESQRLDSAMKAEENRADELVDKLADKL